MQQLVDGMTADGHTAAADAIMTTDTVRKEVAVEFEIDGKVCHPRRYGKRKWNDSSEYGDNAQFW